MQQHNKYTHLFWKRYRIKMPQRSFFDIIFYITILKLVALVQCQLSSLTIAGLKALFPSDRGIAPLRRHQTPTIVRFINL